MPNESKSALGLVYLCSPYTSMLADPEARLVEERFRYQRMVEILAKLIDQGYHVFSPIVHCHPAKVVHPAIAGHWEYWAEYNQTFLRKANAIALITLHSWEKSKGCAFEIHYAHKLGLPTFLVDEFHPTLDCPLSSNEFKDLLEAFTSGPIK